MFLEDDDFAKYTSKRQVLSRKSKIKKLLNKEDSNTSATLTILEPEKIVEKIKEYDLSDSTKAVLLYLLLQCTLCQGATRESKEICRTLRMDEVTVNRALSTLKEKEILKESEDCKKLQWSSKIFYTTLVSSKEAERVRKVLMDL